MFFEQLMFILIYDYAGCSLPDLWVSGIAINHYFLEAINSL